MTTTTIQRGAFGTVADAQLQEAAPTTTGGTNPSSGVGGVAPARRRMLLSFDLSSIPHDAVVASATLRVVVSVTRPAGVIDALVPTVAWTEASATWAGLGTSFATPIPQPSVSTSPGSAGTPLLLDLTALAAGWIAAPASNLGIALEAVDGSTSTIWASEAPVVGNRPSLAVTWTPAPPPPPPCTLPGQAATTPSTIVWGSGSTDVFDRYAVGSPSRARTVIAIHGGGGTGGSRTDALATVPFAKMRAAAGDVVLCPDYPLAAAGGVNVHPAGLEAIRRLLVWLVAIDPSTGLTYCEGLGGDPNRIVLVGFSWGADLAVMAALTLGVTGLPHGAVLSDASAALGAVKACIGYYTCGDFTDPTRLNAYSGTGDTNLLLVTDCTSFADPAFVPRAADSAPATIPMPVVGTRFLFLHGTSDAVVWPGQSAGSAAMPLPNGKYLAGLHPMLVASGNTSAIVIAPAPAGHMFDPSSSAPELIAANCAAKAAIEAV